MINIVRNLDNANFVTHAGKFHADEIFATILLEEIYGVINLIRLPEVDGLNLDNKFVYDIGGGEFDHHQVGGNGQRNSGIKYAAFGLVWKAFGRKFLEQKNSNNIEDCFYMFDKNFVQFIDAGDNGQIKYENIDMHTPIVLMINGTYYETADSDVAKIVFAIFRDRHIDEYEFMERSWFCKEETISVSLTRLFNCLSDNWIISALSEMIEIG